MQYWGNYYDVQHLGPIALVAVLRSGKVSYSCLYATPCASTLDMHTTHMTSTSHIMRWSHDHVSHGSVQRTRSLFYYGPNYSFYYVEVVDHTDPLYKHCPMSIQGHSPVVHVGRAVQ